MNTFTLTRSEREIMSLLWKVNEPLTTVEIVEQAQSKSWKSKSINVLINGLLEKDAVKICDLKKVGNHYCRTFAPTLSQHEYWISLINRSGDSASNMENVVLTFVENNPVSLETLKSLQRIVNDRLAKTASE